MDVPLYSPDLMRTGISSYKINSRAIGHVNKRFGLHLLEGYRFNTLVAAELEAFFYGQSSDLLAAYAVYTPKRNESSALHLKEE